MRLAGLCKGSTADSDSVCEGSNPSPAAKALSIARSREFFYYLFFYFYIKNVGCRLTFPAAAPTFIIGPAKFYRYSTLCVLTARVDSFILNLQKKHREFSRRGMLSRNVICTGKDTKPEEEPAMGCVLKHRQRKFEGGAAYAII